MVNYAASFVSPDYFPTEKDSDLFSTLAYRMISEAAKAQPPKVRLVLEKSQATIQ